MKVDINIEDIILNKILETEDNRFASFSILKDIIISSKIFKSSLNDSQIKDFDNIIDKIEYYESSRAEEIVRLAIFLYKNL